VDHRQHGMGVDKVWCPDPLGLRQSLGVSPMHVMKQGDEEAIPVGPSRIAFKGFPYERNAFVPVAGQSVNRKRHLLTTLRGGSSRATMAGWFPERELDQAA
jgi:hypothetical protein